LAREADARADSRLIESNTLRACERYYSDPVISEATRRIWVASNNGTDYTNAAIDSHDRIITLNCLDGIAVSIRQHASALHRKLKQLGVTRRTGRPIKMT